METLVFILLIIAVVLPFIGLLFLLIGGILFKNSVCLKIGFYSFLLSIICFIGGAVADGVDGKKTVCSKTEIAEEKVVKVVKTKKEPVIDTIIVIKNSIGIVDTTYVYKFKK